MLSEARRQEEDLHWEAAYTALEGGKTSGDLRILIERARLAERIGLFEGDPSWTNRAIEELESGLLLCPVDLRLLMAPAGAL